jgi:NADH-quinone oxidoreductase subunit C
MADEVTAADAATPPQVPELPQDPHEALGQLIVERARGGVTGFRVTHGELMLDVPLGSILDVLAFLKADGACRFALLADLTAVDWPGREKRFDIVYNLLSMYTNRRVRVKVQVSEEEMVPSATAIHACANWFEREVFDMFGIVFTGHPDLRRLLTDYGFQGHPLRKDFPLTGYNEVRYDEVQKRVVYEPVRLVQEWRNFDFLSPWEGGAHALPGDEKADSTANSQKGLAPTPNKNR